MNQMTSVWDRIHEYIEVNVPEFMAYLRPAATDEELNRATCDVSGLHFPTDLQHLYSVHNGTFWKPFFDGCYFMSIDDVIDTWSHRKHDLERFRWNDKCEMDEEQENDRKIRYKWWINGWVPFAVNDTTGETISIDVNPTASGTCGQVFLWYPDFRTQWLASTLLEYLENFAQDLEKGRYDLKKAIRRPYSKHYSKYIY